VEVKGIALLPANWKNRVSSVGSCVGPIQEPPADITTVAIIDDDRRKNYTVEIPRGPCTSMTKGRHWSVIDVDSVSTPGCVYWYNQGSDCTGMRRKVDNATLSPSAFTKGRATWSNPYVSSFQTCAEYKSGPSYVAIYEFPQLNIGYNSFKGFRLEPRSCIDLWGTEDKWVASVDADCAILFDGHWCTEESRKIVGAAPDLGNWMRRISSIGSCDGPIPTGRPENSSLLTFYSRAGFEGTQRLYQMKPGECVKFSQYADDPRSASSDGCVQLYSNWGGGCDGPFKRLDGHIEDLMDWTEDKNKFNAYRPKAGRRCES